MQFPSIAFLWQSGQWIPCGVLELKFCLVLVDSWIFFIIHFLHLVAQICFTPWINFCVKALYAQTLTYLHAHLPAYYVGLCSLLQASILKTRHFMLSSSSALYMRLFVLFLKFYLSLPSLASEYLVSSTITWIMRIIFSSSIEYLFLSLRAIS